MNHASISGRNLDKAITSDDILGKNVIDIEGKILGVAEKVLIDSKSLDFIGIEVDKGFLKKGITIGKSYIEKITHHAVFLNIKVVYEIKGLKVYDKTGANLGTVSNLELYGIKNKIKKLFIKQGFAKKQLEIPSDFIETIGYSVILNVKKKKILKYNSEKIKESLPKT